MKIVRAIEGVEKAIEKDDLRIKREREIKKETKLIISKIDKMKETVLKMDKEAEKENGKKEEKKEDKKPEEKKEDKKEAPKDEKKPEEKPKDDKKPPAPAAQGGAPKPADQKPNGGEAPKPAAPAPSGGPPKPPAAPGSPQPPAGQPAIVASDDGFCIPVDEKGDPVCRIGTPEEYKAEEEK